MLRRLTHLHSEVDAQVDVLSPHVVGGLVVEHGEDAAVQVGLAGRLPATGYGDDGGAGAVPGDQVGGPTQHKARRKPCWGGRPRYTALRITNQC